MATNTTKAGYKKGYEAAQANQPSRSPHRDGTASDAIWLEGFHACMNGDTPPEEPRKRRTKEEMTEALNKPFEPTDWNAPRAPLPSHMLIKSRQNTHHKPTGPRKPGMMEIIFELRDKMKVETDPELLEILTMEHADLEWIICVDDGPRPSERWEEFKKEKGMNFEREVA